MRIRRGDTMIEVMLAITVYSLVALFTINAMKLGIQQGETTLELSQARIEVSAQADAIRYIHNAFLAEREYAIPTTVSYKGLWNKLVENAYNSSDSIPVLSTNDCSAFEDGTRPAKAFIVNTRKIDPATPTNTVLSGAYLAKTDLYPRLVFGASGASDKSYQETGYTNLWKAEGIWVLARKSAKTSTLYTGSGDQPEYFDFHIYACWYAPGANHPTTTGTIIRLYNPSLKEEAR